MLERNKFGRELIYIFIFLILLFNINFIFSQVVNTYYNPYATSTNPYATITNPYATSTNPYATNPYATTGNTFNYGYGSSYSPDYYNQNSYSSSANYGGYNSFGGGYNSNFGNYYGSYDYYGYTNPSVFWPNYNSGDCNGAQNVVLQIAPGGCSPAVVRSDLLEDQNVPVFCKLISITSNPLINLMRIRSVSFQGQYPNGISGISYFPSRSAISSTSGNSLISSPVNSDLGYMVIVLSRQQNENNMSDYIEGNITAVIDFDSESAYGVGQTKFYVSEMSDSDWLGKYRDYGFWNGRAYIRADSIQKDRATISVYRDFNSKQTSVTLKEGETSKDISLSGFYCGAGMNIKLDKIDVPVESAFLQINDKQVWVSKGDKIIDDKCTITNLETYGIGGKISIACPVTNGKIDLSLGAVVNGSVKQVPVQEGLAFEYYNNAVKTYSDLYDFYPNEKRMSEEDTYAAVGLYEAAKLSKLFGMDSKASEFYNKLKKNYPNSGFANTIDSEEKFISNYDTRNSKGSIIINNQQYFIDLLDFRKPAKTDLSVVLVIDGKEQTLALNEITNLVSDGSRNIQISEIKATGVGIKYNKVNGTKKETKTQTLVPGKTEQISLDGSSIKLLRINSNKQVKLSISPVTLGQRGQSSFMFKVGIEKRAIQLSPEQTKDLMKNLLSAMQQWNDINDKLGKLISVMKAACFATSAILTAKTMLTGLSGEAIARNKLMNAAGGWYETCEKLVNEKKYSTLQQCLLDKNSDVEKDIKVYADEIKKTNDLMSNIEKNSKDKNGQIDYNKVKDGFKNEFDSFCNGAQNGVTLPDKTNVNFNGQNGICSWQNMSLEQRRDIMTFYNVKGSGSSVLKDVSEKELGKTVLDAKNYQDANSALINSQKGNSNLNLNTLVPAGDSIMRGDIKRISNSDLTNGVYKNFKEGASVVRVFIPAAKNFGNTKFNANTDVAGKEVIVEVKESSGAKGTYSPSGAVYTVDGKEVTGDGLKSVKEYMSLSQMDRIKSQDLNSYKNPIKNPENLVVKYFETAPFKGLPSEVPFDVNEGWYVELQYVMSGVGKPYDDSGKAVNYYICNVGSNGLIEFKKSADDICRYYNGNTGASLDFPGLSASDSTRLIQRAQQAITDAAKQYGKDVVTINGKTFKSGKSFGGGEGKCTDFMSASDCTLLFNVCDPVICPSSRCDFGGKYKVDNVIQSGVIGSLMLCLPNAKEGVAIPFCLSGIHAGLESYISILNSTVQCLNESLATGRNVGVCDEIKSIYICEFFWRQAAPLMNMIIPALFEGLYGQSRGGGEYLTVQSAWDNTQKAAGWFTSQYAVNSMYAFQARSTSGAGISTGDVGAEFCQSFASINTGDAKSLFENLIEPDSPAQYSAWFSEDVLTTATVPATSHYKVYYHLYAGNDIGTSYIIYLTGLTGTTSGTGSYSGSGVFSSNYYAVASGYVARGSQVDEAKDFTAPSGFKQLCININGKDQCGFGQVSTSYLLNSISDAYVKEQTQEKISKETDCIAGTSSIYSLANPNLQAGVQNTIQPQLYNSGIIRVCSSSNPGKQVAVVSTSDNTGTNYSRWQDVGYCDDTRIRCWLDTNSVKSVVNDKGIQNQIINSGNVNLINQNTISSEQSFSDISIAESSIDSLIISKSDTKDIIEGKIGTIVAKLSELSKSAPGNSLRARSLYSLARLYKKVAEGLFNPANTISMNSSEDYNYNEEFYNYYLENSADTSSSSKVEQSDLEEMTKENGDIFYKVTIFENGETKDYYLTSFDSENQAVVLIDGSVKRVLKDSSGRIIFASSTSSGTSSGSSANTGSSVSSTTGNFVFEFQDGSIRSNIFYRFQDGIWSWSYYQEPEKYNSAWMSVDEDPNIGFLSSPSSENQAFIISMRKKSCNDGLKSLVTRSLKDTNYALMVYNGAISKRFIYNTPSDIDCAKLGDLFK